MWSRRAGGCGATVTRRGLPSVSVPVLSTTSVVICSSSSSASAFLNSTPASAPRPVPTMIDIGVASPSAHGHAMMRTAIALTSAYASRGSGPSERPHDERDDGNDHDRRHEPPRHRVGETLNRRTRSLRFADHANDLREKRVRADALRLHHERARAIDGAACHLIARRLLHRNGLAGHHRFVDARRALDARRRRRGYARRDARAADRRRTRRRAARPARFRPHRCAALFSARGRADCGWRRSCGCARAARAPGRAAPGQRSPQPARSTRRRRRPCGTSAERDRAREWRPR